MFWGVTLMSNFVSVCMFVACTCVTLPLSSAKGRTNFDLRDQLMLDDSSQSMQTFSPRRSSSGRISPFPATASGKKRQNDTGYASSTSSGTPKSHSSKSASTQHAPGIASHLPVLPSSFHQRLVVAVRWLLWCNQINPHTMTLTNDAVITEWFPPPFE